MAVAFATAGDDGTGGVRWDGHSSSSIIRIARPETHITRLQEPNEEVRTVSQDSIPSGVSGS